MYIDTSIHSYIGWYVVCSANVVFDIDIRCTAVRRILCLRVSAKKLFLCGEDDSENAEKEMNVAEK